MLPGSSSSSGKGASPRSRVLRHSMRARPVQVLWLKPLGVWLCGRIENALNMRLAEFYERFLARTDLRMFGGSLEFCIGRRLDAIDKCQTDVWSLLKPRFTLTSHHAWQLPSNASGNRGPVAKDLLPIVLVRPAQGALDVVSP